VTAENSLALCLLDCVPNLGFLIGGYFLVRITRLTERRLTTVLMVGGVAFVFLGGALQLVRKVLHIVLLVGDYRFLGDLQFVLLAPGFVMMLVSVIMVAKMEEPSQKTLVAAMALWKIPLLAVMTLCALGLQGVLAYLSSRRGVRFARAMFVVAAVTILALAGLAGGEQTVTRQWTEESINSLGQVAFATGSYLLYRRYRSDASLAGQELQQARPAPVCR
jgi:hypothetical protein